MLVFSGFGIVCTTSMNNSSAVYETVGYSITLGTHRLDSFQERLKTIAVTGWAEHLVPRFGLVTVLVVPLFVF
jgi:hypothetical protein